MPMNELPGCTRCRAREVPLPRCPYCATLGTELELIKSAEPYHGVVAEELLQRRLLIWAPPAVFLLGYLLMHAGAENFVRIFFGRQLHELGHAVAAWVTGFSAFPGLWVTSVSAERSIAVTLVILGCLGFVGYRVWVAERTTLVYAMAAVAVFVLFCTFGVPVQKARTAITFLGDGGMMLLGCALVLTFWAPVGSHLHTSWLRWGFLVIGMFAILDGVFTWWPARTDPSVIPYGEIDGVGLSDCTKLVDVANWSQQQLIDRYSLVIYIVYAVIAARWAYGVWKIKSEEF